jgi:hypothetical protein
LLPLITRSVGFPLHQQQHRNRSFLMATSHSPTSAPRGLPDGVVDITFSTLADAYTVEAYERGYARGTRDLLAIYPLLVEQYLATHYAAFNPSARRALQAFAKHVQDYVSRRLDDAGFIDGSGI